VGQFLSELLEQAASSVNAAAASKAGILSDMEPT
jgi:hypothetical protein